MVGVSSVATSVSVVVAIVAAVSATATGGFLAEELHGLDIDFDLGPFLPGLFVLP